MGLFGVGKKKDDTIARLETEVSRLQLELNSGLIRHAAPFPGETSPHDSSSSDQNLSRLRQAQQQADKLRREKAQLQQQLYEQDIRHRDAASEARQQIIDAYQQMDALWSAQNNRLEAVKAEHKKAVVATAKAHGLEMEEKGRKIQALQGECALLKVKREEAMNLLHAVEEDNHVSDTEQAALRVAIDQILQQSGILKEERDSFQKKYESVRQDLDAKNREAEESSQAMTEKIRIIENMRSELETSRSEKERISQQLGDHESEKQSVLLERNRILVDLGARQRELESCKRENLMKDAKLEYLQQLLVTRRQGAGGPTAASISATASVPMAERGKSLYAQSRHTVVTRQVSTPVFTIQERVVE